jgi:hypothetical protein
MSKFLSAAARKEFDDEVQHAFQSGGTDLRNTVTVRNNVVGDTYNFRRMGKGMAKQKPTQALVIPMDIEHELIPTPLKNWHASEYTDIFDQTEVNFDEQQELAMTIAWALGRRLDQIVIDAADAETNYAGQVTAAVGGANTDLNVAKLRRAKRFLDDTGVGNSDRFILHSPWGLEAMLGQEEATSADYNTIRALVNGEINSFVGFQFRSIEAREEGGLPKSGDIRTSFAYHRSAVGLAIGMDMSTEVNYIAERTSWLATGKMKAGSVVRDGEGVVEILTDESE